MKIGQLVKSFIPQILDYASSQNSEELINLLDDSYSKQTFGINYPFLVKVSSDIVHFESKRFWKTEYKAGDNLYRVCSQWVVTHKTKFLNYLLEHKLINESKFDDLNTLVQYTAQPTRSTPKIIQRKTTSNLDNYFDQSLIGEASLMAYHYQKFYCLERSIRNLVREVMSQHYGDSWWSKIDRRVRHNVSNNMEYEFDTSHTKRSEHKIDYTTFGDLRKIINADWRIFQPKFNRNLTSVNEVLVDINRLRVPIAHCTPLVDKEVKRLDIRIDDWFELLK